MSAIIVKEAEDSLNLMWSAYQRSEVKGVESSLKISQRVLSPYWLPNYTLSTRLERAGAGVGLGYLNARYYEGSRGQFLSQDPVFWALSPNFLADQQQLNAYNYARNNPIVYKDPFWGVGGLAFILESIRRIRGKKQEEIQGN